MDSLVVNRVETNLTAQELAILRLIGKGMTTAQISQTICSSDTTISYHCTNIFRKLGVKNRVQAITTSLLLGILTFSELQGA